MQLRVQSSELAAALFGPANAPCIPPRSRRVYTADEIAPMFGVSKQWLLRHTRRAIGGARIVPHIRIGKMIRFKLEDVQKYFETHSVQ